MMDLLDKSLKTLKAPNSASVVKIELPWIGWATKVPTMVHEQFDKVEMARIAGVVKRGVACGRESISRLRGCPTVHDSLLFVVPADQP